MWLVGFVRYHDIWDDHYITGFAKVFDQVEKKFIVRVDEKYNYTRRDTLIEIPTSSAPSQAGRDSLAMPHDETLVSAA